jgi:cytochrome c oxidase subunit II
MTYQSVLDPAGPQAAHIVRLWWWFLGTTTVVSVIVLVCLAWAVVRGRRADAAGPSDGTQRDRGIAAVVSLSVTVTVFVLLGLLVGSVWTARVGASRPFTNAVSIMLTGHQWWWEVEYEDAVPSRRVTLANDLHIPVGRPVVVKVTSRDVIHSFWIPNLAGKRDLIPGYTTAIWLQADRPGVYRGQCAEFCGRQHANMAIEVRAESESDFNQWLENQRQAARAPANAETERGLGVFMAGQCVACHSIRGTLAHGQLGPDLTHVATRPTLGAGTLPNTRERLVEWIANSQQFKPGNLMPPNVMAAGDLAALAGYLSTLK